MTLSGEEMLRIKESIQDELLRRPGVNGVDVGIKYVDGEPTDELAICVFVEKKWDVPPDERIPETIEGIKTDVIEARFESNVEASRIQMLSVDADKGRYDPLMGGISGGPCRLIGGLEWLGTLGAIVTDNGTGNKLLLSNFHVLAADAGWSVGDEITQPGRQDGGTCPADVVGTLQRAVIGGTVDCAVASIVARPAICEIAEIGPVTGTVPATWYMPVRKRGRSTRLTFGRVEGMGYVGIAWVSGVAIAITGQIRVGIDPARSGGGKTFCQDGDSGSVVVDDSARVTGLLFAKGGGGKWGLCNPIDAVLTALDVTICV